MIFFYVCVYLINFFSAMAMLGLRIKKTRKKLHASEYVCPGEGKGKPDFMSIS